MGRVREIGFEGNAEVKAKAESTAGVNTAAADERLVEEAVVEVCSPIAGVVTIHDIAGDITEDDNEVLRTAIRWGRSVSDTSFKLWTVSVLASNRDLLLWRYRGTLASSLSIETQ